MDVHNTRGASATDMMIRIARAHVKGIRAHPCLQDARVVFMCERNLGDFAQHVSAAMVRIPGVSAIAPAREDAYGVRTLPDMRTTYAAHLRWRFKTRSLSLHHGTLVCENPMSSANESKAARIARTLKEFERQLRGFQSWAKMPTMPTSRITFTYSGKVGPDRQTSKRFRDDMVMCLMMCLWYSLHHVQGNPDLREIDGAGALRVMRDDVIEDDIVASHMATAASAFGVAGSHAATSGATARAALETLKRRGGGFAEPGAKRSRV